MTTRYPIRILAQVLMAFLGALGMVSVPGVPALASPSYNLSPLPGPGTTSSNDGLIPPSRFTRRPDYRQLEQQQASQQTLQKGQQLQQTQEAQRQQLAAQAAQVKQAAQLNQKAVALGKAGRFAEAIPLHEKAVQLDPSNKQLRINLSAARAAYGKQRLAAGDLNEAGTLFRKALAAAPDNGLAGKLLSETLKRMGRNPASATVRLALGDQLASQGDLEGAAVEYEAAMQLDPSARTYSKVGDIALRCGQATTAANWYQQALMKDPNYGPAYRQLGFMQAAQGDYTGAAASLRKALIWDPKDSAASQVLVEIWRREVAANASAQNHLGLAGALQLSGDLQGAANEYREVQALDAHNPELEPGLKSLAHAIANQKAQHHYEAAETLFGQGLIKDALAEVGQAVMSEPRNVSYQYLLGQCLESSGDYNAARRSYLACVLIDPEKSKEAAARLHDLETHVPGSSNSSNSSNSPHSSSSNVSGASSRVSTQSGVTTATEGTSQTASNVNPDLNPELQAQLDKIAGAEADRDYDSAVSMLTNLAKANLSNPEIHHRLAVDLLANGQVSEAISEFRLVCAMVPGNKAYAEDLDRAQVIHKRAMASNLDATAFDAQNISSRGGQ